MLCRCIVITVIATGVAMPTTRATQLQPPDGFRPLFNGTDLRGWYGLNPHTAAKLQGDQRQAILRQQREQFADHWRVENGELVNDGQGPYATSEEEFGDLELLLEYKTVAGADSGIYLRGTPQVQIWDWHQAFDPRRPTRKPHLGSGGLFNNTAGRPGRDPLVLADNPFGQWNRFRIRQIGDLTWVWLNERLVVDGAVMENFWDRGQPLPAAGPIMLQTHGGEIRWRNIFVREIERAAAAEMLRQQTRTASTVARSLTLHASFDHGLDADYARGDRTCYVRQGDQPNRATPNDDVRLASQAGRFGGALHFPHKSGYRPAFRDDGVLGYNDADWDATVSMWLRLNPDQDLEPGYCDPVQIIGDNSKKGFVFLEFSKDETPRFFRYAIRPLFEIWNPDNVAWAEIPAERRPMVQIEQTPFSRDSWTHVVFTLENINSTSQPQTGRLYLNGQSQGAIENWNLTFGWDPRQVSLVLGAAYVGYIDDLAVFDRVLNDSEIKKLYELVGGVRQLYSAPAE